jgi:hypothetical protein
MELCRPTLDMEQWVHFGFCACHDESEKGFLNTMYKILANRCSYDEFCTAYNTSKITEILDTNGLRGRRMVLPYLEDVLSGSPRMLKIGLVLKQHV